MSKLEGKTCVFLGDFAYWPEYRDLSPPALARKLGARVLHEIAGKVDYVIIGGARGHVEEKTKAKKLAARGAFQLLDEAGYADLLRVDVAGKTFCFVGGFACVPGAEADVLLRKMVENAGGEVRAKVDDDLDYLVVGRGRVKGKADVEKAAKARIAAGRPLSIIGETEFLDLVRVDTSKSGASVDFATLVSNLNASVDAGKLSRALKMLQSESFKLYSKHDEASLYGVVRSQTGVGTVYAPWLRADGRYGCSTPELEDCMGMQGVICKHLLVLLVGLSRAGELDPGRALEWVRKAAKRRPVTDTDLAANAFLQYKGAEAGEIDWRPTETIPEDYYAL